MKSKPKGSKADPTQPQNLLKELATQSQKLFSGAFRVQYGALCFRQKGTGPDIEILLITSRDTGRWVIPKGWPMKRKPPHQAAATEAMEEAGVRGKANKTSIGRYIYLKELANGSVTPVIVEMYQVHVTKVHKEYKEKGQRVLAWVDPSEAARRVREVELKSLLVNFKPIDSD
jgi:8-oxo-dGTP pyrophosphatase MutT (NUDIX family)